MSEFIWDDRYNIGDSTIDAQHRRLFELANQLVEASGNAEITRLLMLFYQHVREHFQVEEAVMKQTNYPHYRKHVQSHNRMLDRLVEISEAVRQSHWNPSDIRIFVQEWVLVHIMDEDMMLGEYLKLGNPQALDTQL